MNLEAKTFKHGVHPLKKTHHGKTATQSKPIEIMASPKTIIIPLSQHIGAPCSPCVSKGDRVLRGQVIGEAKGFVSAPVHASVSGTVKEIAHYPHPLGTPVMSVCIENDGMDETLPDIPHDYTKLSKDELKKLIFEAGIVGMGGAAFPAHVKLSPPPEKRIDCVVVNGTECEPYLTSDHRMMLEYPEEAVRGIDALMRVVGAERAIIGIELNKPDAIETMRQICAGFGNIEVLPLKVKYPQGAEKQLIHAALGRIVPGRGLPLDVGCVVQNVSSARAVYQAVAFGRPLTERVVTVTGAGIKKPSNLMVRIGTPIRDVIEYAGGFTSDDVKLISGGPMMGMAQFDLGASVTKGTSGLLALAGNEAHVPESSACIRCGKCASVCPLSLMPLYISAYSEQRRWDMAEKYNALDCYECGCCTYICPASRHITHLNKVAKREIMAQRKRAEGKER